MNYLKPIYKRIFKPLKKCKIFIKQKLGWLDIPKILPYKGFGNENEVYISGMIIEDKGLAKPHNKQNFLQNMLATVKRFTSDEIAGVRVKANFLGEDKIAETDQQGFFTFHFIVKNKIKKTKSIQWLPVSFELIDKIVENQPHTSAKENIMIIPESQKRIFISDIDDTIIISHSTRILKKIYLMLFRNALTRSPFAGISKFYRALEDNKNGRKNPFFYVSSSEWNLYDLLDDFFSFNNLPKGVFMLRKINHNILKFWKYGGDNHRHKYEKIKFLLLFYPNQQFILIGDSSQKDPEIYSNLAIEFPGRIETIIIRKTRLRNILDSKKNIQEKLSHVKTHYFEVERTHEAALISLKLKYIDSDYFSDCLPAGS